MTIDANSKTLDALVGYSQDMASGGATGNLKATWIAPGYAYPYPSTYWPPVTVSSTPHPKSDGPFILATLAQLLSEGKITEDTFARLAERVIQRGT